MTLPPARLFLSFLSLLLILLSAGCSTRRLAAGALADALAGSGSLYARDDDPDLVRSAVPFGLKLIEGHLDELPDHAGLRLAAAAGFTQYAYAFVQQDADELEATDLKAAEALRARARRLYLRARDHGLRGLEARHAGLTARLRAEPGAALNGTTVDDVPLLYWTAVSWAGAVSLGKDDPALIAQLPAVAALADRALALDESFDRGALHSFLITFTMGRPDATAPPAEQALRHFELAVALSAGQDPAPFIARAEAVCIQQQDARTFTALLERALAIDPDAQPERRLATLVMQRRARWLLARRDEWFLPEQP